MLSRWQSTIVDAQGNVQPLANLTVRLESDQSLAKMWASPGTTQPLPDGMVQADGNGYAFFYARGGLYRIQSVALGIDWRHVQIGAALVSVGDYGPGLEITARNQIFWRDGELYRAGAALESPYTTTGDWGDEEGLFVAVGDQSLRQELADSNDPDNGAGMVGYRGTTASSALDLRAIYVDCVQDLETMSTSSVIDGQSFIVRGFYRDPIFPSDSATPYGYGGGTFNYSSTSVADVDGGVVIQGNGDGRFIRSFDGPVNVQWWGAKGDGDNDDTNAIQAAIDFQAAVTSWRGTGGRGSVFFPAGTYRASKIIRKSGVSIVGEGSRSTFLENIAVPDPGIPFGFIEISDGAVVGSHMTGFTVFNGANLTTQWAMYIHAKWGPEFSGGGLWHSRHEDVLIRDFRYGIWSRGGYTWAHSLRPNQFLDFVGVGVFIVPNGGIALRLTGQHGQINFQNGDYGGLSGIDPSTYPSVAIAISWDPDPSTTAVDGAPGESTSDVSGVGDARRAGDNINFTKGTSIQRANLGMSVRGARNVVVDGCWLESLGSGFELREKSNVILENSYLANAADGSRLSPAAPGAGWLYRTLSDSHFTLGQGNGVRGTLDNIQNPNGSLAESRGASLASLKVSTHGKTSLAGQFVANVNSAGIANILSHDFVRIGRHASANLEVLDSEHMPGAIVCARPVGGDLTVSNSGNIWIPDGDPTITIPQNGIVMLVRTWDFSGREWAVVSASA